MRAFLVCVDYADLLAVTLKYNRHHFHDVVVVTALRDQVTREVAAENRARCYCTDSFYADGAKFNKWRALEEALDWAGRLGWICLMDADVLWPKNATKTEWWDRRVGEGILLHELITPRRRMAPWPCRSTAAQRITVREEAERQGLDTSEPWLADRIPPENRWPIAYPLHRNDAEHAGYSQIFHATDPALGQPPWHDTSFCHAGISDSIFQAKWRPEKKIRPPWECLHLGEAGVNWAGRATPLADGTVPEGAAERREYSSRTIWEQRRANRRAGRDQFEGERLGQ